MELVQIYLTNLNKLAIITNFHAFFPPGSTALIYTEIFQLAMTWN